MVFVPIYDDNHLKFIPFQATTWILIAINFAVFVWQETLSVDAFDAFAVQAGVVPASLFGGGASAAGLAQLPPGLSLITYMFLHGNIWHLLGNMAFLWVFGDNVEDAMGSIRFFVFYLLCGVAAALGGTPVGGFAAGG